MKKNKAAVRLIKDSYGFYRYTPIPKKNDLEKYYRTKYYQQERGNYKALYSDEELEWNRLKALLIYKKIESFFRKKGGTIIDIGCGEGWLLDLFYKNKWSILGVDLSDYAIKKNNNHLLPFFVQEDIYRVIKRKVKDNKKIDVIFLGNIVEHVVNPIKLLKTLQSLMHENSLLVIMVPNDFSKLQKHLAENKFTPDNWWLAYPDHLSYFNKDNFERLLQSLGFRIKTVVADSVIDLNLFNQDSNYVKYSKKGRAAHMARVRIDNFLAGIDSDKLLHIYECFGSMGIGRDLIYYCQYKNNK